MLTTLDFVLYCVHNTLKGGGMVQEHVAQGKMADDHEGVIRDYVHLPPDKQSFIRGCMTGILEMAALRKTEGTGKKQRDAQHTHGRPR